jgi:DNA-directed RNA polymerase specialized sigma24 family protein
MTDEEKQRSQEIEGYLRQWAYHVRGHIELGYPTITMEADHIFGNGRPISEWPPEVIAVEDAVCAMPERVKAAVVYYYVRHRHIHSIARSMHCGYETVGDLLNKGREFVAGWLRMKRVA